MVKPPQDVAVHSFFQLTTELHFDRRPCSFERRCMSTVPNANIEVTYLVPSVSFEIGGWVIVWVNGHPVLKHIPPPPPDDLRNTLHSVLTAASLQRLAMLTEKSGLEPQLM